MDIKIFFEDNDIIVALKPAGVPVQPDKTGDKDMLTTLCEMTNNNDIGLIHRLDRPVGGIMVFSKNKKTEAKLSKLMSENNINKTYMAVVYGKTPKDGTMTDFIVKNSRLNTSSIVDSNVKGSKKAVLHYETVAFKNDSELGDISLVKIKLETGRHHQIRVQFANAGFPLLGDQKYGIKTRTRKRFNVALFSCGLSFKLDNKREVMDFFYMPKDYPFDIFN
ncbi:MAG: RNA pseudouridine synthase [Tyzzerella sp.]|uniref:RNA pseudouridylate synthase n=1 Tax=Candidatus Fimicola merdigallinarum TaxID=2840819 RepID=A0A9D9DUZ1_9FIRM|nr:RNA pseudouridine synthase [Candidatus Fimicola merdigallinarum]